MPPDRMPQRLTRTVRVIPRPMTLVAAMLMAATNRVEAQTTNWDTLDRTSVEVMRATKTPGIQIAVIRGDSIIYIRGFGVADIETGAPMTPDLLAQVGSLTKPFTAALVLSIAQQRA